MEYYILTRLELLDSKLSFPTISANCFVDTSISTTTDETNDFVLVNDADFALIAYVCDRT